MKYIHRILFLILHRKSEFFALLLEKFGGFLDDVLYTRIIYWLKMGKTLNLENPKTFNEKLQWLKLFDHNPLYTNLVDKYSVKDYVASRIGDKYIIPTIAVYNRPEEIDWDILPNQFVLKTTQGGGGDGVIICKDKKSFDRTNAIQRLKIAMITNPYKRLREWPYKNVPRRIIAEEYISESNGELLDYKFFCFNGKVKCMKVDFDRFTNHSANYYNTKGVLLPFEEVAYPSNPNRIIEFPTNFNQMVFFAEKLSEEIPFLRVDFYNLNGSIYFGELTFFPAGGIGKFEPNEWDLKLGEWLHLPIGKIQ